MLLCAGDEDVMRKQSWSSHRRKMQVVLWTGLASHMALCRNQNLPQLETPPLGECK